MRKELQEIEIIENYLMGKMNAAEKAEFKKQLETDANLAESVELQKILMSGLERIGLKKDLQIAKRNLFLRKVWTWFGVVLMLSAIGFLGYTNFVTLSDSRSGQNNNNLVTENDTTNFVMQNNSLAKVNGGKEFVTLSDSLAKVNGGKEFVTLSDSLAKVKGDKEFVTLSDSLAKVNGDKEFVTLSDSRSGQDFESAEIPVKQFQTFSIDPTKASSITGAEGTIIDFPANAFDTKSKEKVEIKLQEFYKLSDMVFANLTTQTAGGELIETGGMVQIEASQPSISKLNLAPDKSITLKFPFETKKEDMKTFTGEKDDLGNVVWEEEKYAQTEIIEISDQINENIISSSIFTIVENMPYWKECEIKMKKALIEKCTNQKITNHLKDNIEIDRRVFRKSVNGRVYISYIINERGFVENASIIRSLGPMVDKLALEAVYSLPRFIPGKQRGIPVKVLFTVPLNVNIEVEVDDFSIERFNKTVKDLNIKKAKRDSILLNKISPNIENLELNEEAGNSISNYILSSGRLGFINCDRYPFATKGKSSFNIVENDRKINCSLVLHSVRGIASPRYIKQGKYIFPQLPNEEEVSVLAFKTENNKNYVSYYKTIHNKQDHRFEFEPLTKEKLNQITSELDAIKN